VKAAGFALAGWLVPGGAFLLSRRYGRFAAFASLVSITFAAGLMLHGAWQIPQPAELAGLTGFEALAAWAGALTRMLAGLPCLMAQAFGSPQPPLTAQLHEYGTTLLTLSGIFNLLAVSSALESR
jgi:hypothetical protein